MSATDRRRLSPEHSCALIEAMMKQPLGAFAGHEAGHVQRPGAVGGAEDVAERCLRPPRAGVAQHTLVSPLEGHFRRRRLSP